MHQWAQCFNVDGHPSSDSPIEGYHRRLKGTVFKTLQNDFVGVFRQLEAEAGYWEGIVHSDEQLAAKQAEAERIARTRVETIADRRERERVTEAILMTEKDRVPAAAQPERQGSPQRSGSISDAGERDVVGADDGEVDGEVSPSAQRSPTAVIEQLALAPEVPARPSALEPQTTIAFSLADGPCSGCKKPRASRNLCAKHLCAKCCARTFGECGKKGHNTERRRTLVRPLYGLVANAFSLPKDQDVWIKYHKPGEAPRVHKLRALRAHDQFQSADYFLATETRTNGDVVETTYRISRMEALSLGPL